MNRRSNQYGGDSFASRNDGKDNFKFRQQNGSNRKPPPIYQQQQYSQQNQQQQNQSNQQDLSSKANTQPCIVCSKSSVCVCSRCGDYYCSPTCQQEDWRRHRYICMAMPPLVPANYRPMTLPGIPQLFSGNNMENRKEKEYSFGQVNVNHEPSSAPTMFSNQMQQNIFMGPIPNANYPKDKSRVMLIGFRTPNRCFIRSLEVAEHNAYLKTCKAISESGKNAPKLQNLPKPGQFVLALLQADGLFHRAEVIGARDADNIRLLYIDYGTLATKKLSDLKQMSEDIHNLQRYTLQVSLKDVPNYTMDESMFKILSNYENLECKIEYTKEENNTRECILRSWNKNEIINEKLADINNLKAPVYKPQTSENVVIRVDDNHSSSDNKKDFNKGLSKSPLSNQKLEIGRNYATNFDKGAKNENKDQINIQEHKSINNKNDRNEKPDRASAKTETAPPPRQIQKPVLIPPFEIVPFPKSASNLQVVSLDDSNISYGYFGCISLSDLQNFKQVQEYLQNYEDTKIPYSPKKDEYCLAKFEDEWFRAKVIDSPESNSFTVYYMDYTNESLVKSDDIRRYPMDFKLPCTTNLCMIDGLPEELNSKLLKYMKNRMGCNEVAHTISKVLKYEENVTYVQMDELIEELKKESLL